MQTYKHAVIEPGPKLNLVLGPNGGCCRAHALPRSAARVLPACLVRKELRLVPPLPGHLNLVLPPSWLTHAGTGKSSLVCAICVGLAGRTNLLGRAEDVSSFVRKGSQVRLLAPVYMPGLDARASLRLMAGTWPFVRWYPAVPMPAAPAGAPPEAACLQLRCKLLCGL